MARMFLDQRLWEFAAAVRSRIAAVVIVGLAAATVGIVRLGLLGWLLAELFAGASLGDLIVPCALVAGVMVLRGVLEYWRTMIAHRTAASVQLALRERLYDKVVGLGPAHFGLQRTGGVLLSMVEGVEQLETYFGQYLPQVFVAALTPFVVFALMAFVDVPVAAVLLSFALITLIAPSAFQRWDAENSRKRQRAYAAFAAEFLDTLQGLATLKAFGQSAERGRLLAERAREVFRTTMWVLATNTLTRGITDTGLAVGAAAALGLGAWRVSDGTMEIGALLVVLMMGIEVFRPQRELRELLHQGMVAQAAAQGIFEVLESSPLIEPRTDVPRRYDLEPTVAFRDVCFAYPGARRAAHDRLDLEVRAASGLRWSAPAGLASRLSCGC